MAALTTAAGDPSVEWFARLMGALGTSAQTERRLLAACPVPQHTAFSLLVVALVALIESQLPPVTPDSPALAWCRNIALESLVS